MLSNFYFCESFNQIPLAILLHHKMPKLVVLTKHESFQKILLDLGVKSELYKLVDFNQLSNPLYFFKSYFLYICQLVYLIIRLKNSNIFTTSATVNVSLFPVYCLCKFFNKSKIIYAWWNTDENLVGLKIPLGGFFINKILYFKMYTRLFFYKILLYYKIKIKNFNGEFFYCIDQSFFDDILIFDNREKYQNDFSVIFKSKNKSKKIIFICGGYRARDEFKYYGEEKVCDVFNIFEKYKDKFLFKLHPSGVNENYFEGTKFNFDTFDLPAPVESFVSEGDLIFSFGSSSLVNLGLLGIKVYCLNTLEGYRDGSITNELPYFYSKQSSNVLLLKNLIDIEKLINCYIAHK
jgi:hypothetical protein